MSTTRRQQQAHILRIVRKIHRWTGIALFGIFIFISITGLLLGWKKNSNGYILPDTQKGITTDATQWQPLSALQGRAAFLMDSLDSTRDATIDRVDVRPDKGVAKFTFKTHYQELQLDMATGRLLSYAERRSDWLEQIHDGSIVDKYGDVSFFKLLYTTLSGLALLTFSLTGFWLWYGPRRMRTAAENRDTQG